MIVCRNIGVNKVMTELNIALTSFKTIYMMSSNVWNLNRSNLKSTLFRRLCCETKYQSNQKENDDDLCGLKRKAAKDHERCDRVSVRRKSRSFEQEII